MTIYNNSNLRNIIAKNISNAVKNNNIKSLGDYLYVEILEKDTLYVRNFNDFKDIPNIEKINVFYKDQNDLKNKFFPKGSLLYSFGISKSKQSTLHIWNNILKELFSGYDIVFDNKGEGYINDIKVLSMDSYEENNGYTLLIGVILLGDITYTRDMINSFAIKHTWGSLYDFGFRESPYIIKESLINKVKEIPK